MALFGPRNALLNAPYERISNRSFHYAAHLFTHNTLRGMQSQPNKAGR